MLVAQLFWWIQGVRRWRRGRKTKQKDICHFPELVILHSLLFMWTMGARGGGGIICFLFLSLFFSRMETLELYLLLWFCMWEGASCLVDELDKLLLDHSTDSCVVIHFCSSTQPQGCGDICADGGPRSCSTCRSAGTMGHGPFHCIAPFLTSVVHMAAVFIGIDTLATTLSVAHPPHPIDFTDWITLPVLSGSVCACVRVLPICTEGHWHGQCGLWIGLMYVLSLLKGAILHRF